MSNFINNFCINFIFKLILIYFFKIIEHLISQRIDPAINENNNRSAQHFKRAMLANRSFFSTIVSI